MVGEGAAFLGVGSERERVGAAVSALALNVLNDAVPSFDKNGTRRHFITVSSRSRNVPRSLAYKKRNSSRESTPRPVSAWTWRGLNLHWFAGALGDVHPEPPATGFRRLRTGIVDADVAFELGHSGTSDPSLLAQNRLAPHREL